jgi:hypothetical protein
MIFSGSISKLNGLVVWATQPVWKLKIPKLDENDILVFDLEIEWACNAGTSKALND